MERKQWTRAGILVSFVAALIVWGIGSDLSGFAANNKDEKGYGYVFQQQVALYDHVETGNADKARNATDGKALKADLISALRYAGEYGGEAFNKEKFYAALDPLQSMDSSRINKDENRIMAIHAFLKAYDASKNKKYLERAEQWAVPLVKKYKADREYWFEKGDNAADGINDLNMQLYGCAVFKKLWDTTHNDSYQEILQRAVAMAEKNLKYYDTGEGLRRNLEPVNQAKFRLVNPYGYDIDDIAIDKITMREPLSGKEFTIDVGTSDGHQYLAGDWKNAEVLDGVSVCRVKHNAQFVVPFDEKPQQEALDEWYELGITYRDEKRANLAVEIESSINESGFKTLRDGELLVDGKQAWKTWKIPVRITDLGTEMNKDELKAAAVFLNFMKKDSKKLKKWGEKAQSYYHLKFSKEQREVKQLSKMVYPSQTFPIAWQIQDGLVVQRLAGEHTKTAGGIWDGKSELGDIMVTPYPIAIQAKGEFHMGIKLESLGIKEPEYGGLPWLSMENSHTLSKAVALQWLEDNKISISGKNKSAYIWTADKENAYSDVVQTPPWASAFFQRHIIEAFLLNDKLDMAVAGARAYAYPVDKSGLCSNYWNGKSWYEEVPNSTHILNAQMASVVALKSVFDKTGDLEVKELYQEGVDALIEWIADYDTGYWSIYDRNPQKEMIFQLDWLEGEESLLVDDITLVNTQTNTATKIDVGSREDGTGYPLIAGNDWGNAIEEDGKTVRPIVNGYYLRNEVGSVNENRQNTYFYGILPEREYDELFDVPIHKIVIQYKDVGKGKFIVNMRSKNRGNVFAFEPLRNAVIECVGDMKWKTKEIYLYPSDLGWYMGYEYHSYHASELKKIAEFSDSWYLNQYADRFQYYYEEWQNDENVIVRDNMPKYENIRFTPKLMQGKSQSGYELENSLDQDSNDDYTAIEPVDGNVRFTLKLEKPMIVSKLMIDWESKKHYGIDLNVQGKTEDGKLVDIADIKGNNKVQQIIDCKLDQSVMELVFTIPKTAGQNQVLLRQIRALNTLAS
ncbi:D-glucuronyl C5-epimerase family protein [Anaerovorax sp. IOR16]|uniref:D-glucuronyl C5-epimerase family protein n=1 Tax=Anaerovorax sp. IOR16 TaxID=2773458 RepID=UPI0019CF8E37|nr:D-glucuronyl C5-epimerase family protein [Anaerovorax sp. IOR16]